MTMAKNIPWSRLIAESLLVIVSILLAFAIDETVALIGEVPER